MRPTRISGSDPTPLGAPPDWKPDEDGHCSALFIRRETSDGLPLMRSAWEVDDNEAILFLAGARLTLGVAGTCHPVVQLGVADVPDDFQPVMQARRFTAPDGRPCVRVDMLFAANGPRRAYAQIALGEGGLAPAIALGIEQIEQYALKLGWMT